MLSAIYVSTTYYGKSNLKSVTNFEIHIFRYICFSLKWTPFLMLIGNNYATEDSKYMNPLTSLLECLPLDSQDLDDRVFCI